MDMKFSWLVAASTVPATMFAMSAVTTNGSDFIPEHSSSFITETLPSNTSINKKQYGDTDECFIYLMTSEKSFEQIKDRISAIFKKEISMNIRLDSELDVFYFVVYTSEETFDSDYEHLLTVDERMENVTFKGKKVVVTLEEE